MIPGSQLQKDGSVLGGPGRDAFHRVPRFSEEERGTRWNASLPAERLVLETVRVNAERFRPELSEFFRWPMAQILKDSPLLVAERDAEDQFRTWLKLWPACRGDLRVSQPATSFHVHAVIDSAGRSLHGWFDAPRNRVLEQRLKAALVAFGCDPKVFTYSQPVRVPGAFREGRLQRLVWLRD